MIVLHLFINYKNSSTKIFAAEDVLKKRKREIKQAEERAKQKLEVQNKSKKNQTEIYKRPEEFVKEYKNQQHSYVDLKKRVFSFTINFI